MPIAKIRLRAGHVELSFEGSEEYIRTEIAGLFREVVELGGAVSVPAAPASPTDSPPSGSRSALRPPPAGDNGATTRVPGPATDPIVALAAELNVEVVHVVSAC